ncbi:MAG: Wzz/FepE/Etk N-terminal domain-containing protein [Clostridia bacterium]|nr:Wzz/FepE/Etk N-terminal domain-containing protein [Clostridia bacterium]
MKQNELNIRDIFAELKHRIVWIILAAVICGLGAYIYSYSTTVQTYTAQITLFVTNTNRTSDDTDISSSELVTSSKLVESYIAVLKSRKVMDQVAAALPPEVPVSGSQILGMIRTTASGETEKFTVAVISTNSSYAEIIANKIGEIAPNAIQEVTLAGKATVLDWAQGAAPNKVDNVTPTILGALAGFAIACLVIIIIFSFNTTIWDENDLEKRYDIPIFGTIPKLQSSEVRPVKRKAEDEKK